MKIELSQIQIGIVETIIEWAKLAKFSKRTVYLDNGTTFTIPLKAFNITLNIGMNIFMKDLFDLLRQRGCFNSWSQNPYVSNENAQFVFSQVNIKRLENLISPNFHTDLIISEVKTKIKNIKSMDILGPKEMNLLYSLSDLDPHDTENLRKLTTSKALHKVKSAVNKKVGKYGLIIETTRRKGMFAFYQLQITPISE